MTSQIIWGDSFHDCKAAGQLLTFLRSSRTFCLTTISPDTGNAIPAFQ
jgi:hypothetical protein